MSNAPQLLLVGNQWTLSLSRSKSTENLNFYGYNTAAGCSFGMCGRSVSAGISTQLWKMLRMVSCCGKASVVEGAFRKAEKFPKREKKLCVQAMKWLTSAEWLQKASLKRRSIYTPKERARLTETLAFHSALLQAWTLTSNLFFCLSTVSFKHFQLKPSGRMNRLPKVTGVHAHSQEWFLWNWRTVVSRSCKTNRSAIPVNILAFLGQTHYIIGWVGKGESRKRSVLLSRLYSVYVSSHV